MYKIVRHFYDDKRQYDGRIKRTIKTGLSLEEAQRWCHDAETSSRTCTTARMRRYTERNGPWFDGYEET